MKRALSIVIFTGIFLILTACGSGASTEQAVPPTEIPPTATPTEDPGIHLSADGSGDYPDLETAVALA